MGQNDKRRRGASSRSRAVEGHDLPPNTPGADGYKADGTPMFNNKRSAQSFYDKYYEGSNIRMRVDPDGGVPHGEEMRRMLEEERRLREQMRRRGGQR